MPRRRGYDSRINTWDGMLQRCSNPDYPQWKDYGGRGISVRWASREEFFADVGERPPGLTIERIDNDGDYVPGNVRWATRAEQQRNRRNAVFVEIDGERHRLLDLAQQSGLPRNLITLRAKKGLPMEEVLSPKRWHMRERTHCRNGHEASPENTYIAPDGSRNCRACHCLRGRNYRMQER